MKIRLFGIRGTSTVDGEGLRYVVFVQGCTHNCAGCHNTASHALDGGHESDTADILDDIYRRRHILDGVTFSGGEPFLQQAPLIEIAKVTHEIGLDVWCYTGFTYEEVKDTELIRHIDVLVDGKFIEELADNKPYRGSSNQRIIHIQKGKAI